MPIALAFFFHGHDGWSQSTVYSQYQLTGATTSPSRIAMVKSPQALFGYKRQTLMSGLGYSTMSVAGIMPVRAGRKVPVGAVSASITDDRSGENFMLQSTGITVGGSYRIPLDQYNLFAFGLQTGYFFDRINTDRIRTDNQYQDGSYDPTSPTGENFQNNTTGHLLINSGLTWMQQRRGGAVHRWVSVSVFNINRYRKDFTNEASRSPMAMGSRWEH
jgi:hypothetical protein